jgi:hypothetical protein
MQNACRPAPIKSVVEPGRQNGRKASPLPPPHIVAYKITGEVIYVWRILHGVQKWPYQRRRELLLRTTRGRLLLIRGRSFAGADFLHRSAQVFVIGLASIAIRAKAVQFILDARLRVKGMGRQVASCGGGLRQCGRRAFAGKTGARRLSHA